jgi:copper(I)-binding protein
MNINYAFKCSAGIIGVWVMLASPTVMAQQKVEVTNVWARATAPAQKVGAIYMDLRSATAARLVSASSPVAAKTELHNMKLENNIMKMYPVEAIDLPAGQSVKLAPGGFHVMLVDLKRDLVQGDTVPLTLTFEGKDKTRETVEVKAPVRALDGSTGMQHMH